MNIIRAVISIFLLSLWANCVATGQMAPPSVVPSLVSFNGILQDSTGKPITEATDVTFLLYKSSQGGAPLWLERQSIAPDATGHYAVKLGAATSQGIPPEFFLAGEAQWLAVQVGNEPEQPRVMLVPVPYAMKAADADTVGGLPASAFVLATGPTPSGSSATDATTGSTTIAPALTGTGTTDYLPLWTSTTALGSSLLFQSGTGTTAKVGIGTSTPAATLDVKGTETVRGSLSLPAISNATTTAGSDSQPLNVVGSSYSSSSKAAVGQTFRWQVEPTGNNTASPSGTWNLLYGAGSAKPAETGLHIASNGQITFASGQVFPGTGSGTVTSVGLTAPSSDFTVSGSPVTGSGTLNLAWNVAPTSADTPNAIVKRDSFGGFFAGGTINADVFYASKINIMSDSDGNGAGAIDGAVFYPEGYAIIGYSQSSEGDGIAGYTVDNSKTGNNLYPAGVWGDSSVGTGLAGTADDSNAVVGENNSPTGYTTAYFSNASTNAAAYSLYADGKGFGGYCGVDVKGDLTCTGTKSAVVPLDGGRRKVALSAIESPQNWFEDFGSGQLVNGVAVVQLDPEFIQTVNAELDYKVFPVPNGDCKGLYVSNKTATSFEVRELGSGTSNVAFDYRIAALRRNYEGVRFADHTNDPVPVRKQASQSAKHRPLSFARPGRPQSVSAASLSSAK
jgi:hypothetical protein